MKPIKQKSCQDYHCGKIYGQVNKIVMPAVKGGYMVMWCGATHHYYKLMGKTLIEIPL